MSERIQYTDLPEDSEQEIQEVDIGKYSTLEYSIRDIDGLEYDTAPRIHSRIQGESTYSKDFGGVATEIEYFDGKVKPRGWEELWTTSSRPLSKALTDEEKLKPVITTVIPHETPRSSTFKEAQRMRAKETREGVHLLGWTTGSPAQIHYPLKGLDGELDSSDVLGHEMAHKFLGHVQEVRPVEKRLQLIFQKVEMDPEALEFATNMMNEFEVRLFQEAEGYPIDNKCRFDEFVRRTAKIAKRKGGEDFPSSIYKWLAAQALINMEEEGVITQKTARLYFRRIFQSTPKEVSIQTLTAPGGYDLTEPIYDPDDAYLGRKASSYNPEDYQEALRQQGLRYRRVGRKGRWTK